MEFSIGSFAFKVEIKYIGSGHPRMSKRAKRRLAKQVLATVTRDTKIERIKALRQISIGKSWGGEYIFGLRSAKDWVEEVFADNGAGEIAI